MNSLTDGEKVDVRRFCGYPAYGASAGGQESWRYFQTYGLLEFRLNNLSDPEIGIIRRYLGTLSALEAAVPATSDNLDTDQAAVWTRNKDEIADRLHLFDEWRRRLCGFLGVIAGQALSRATATLIV